MIAELYGIHGGTLYYRLDNWHGFFQRIPDSGHTEQYKHVPDDAVCLIRDGRWTGNMISDGFYQ